MKITRIAIQEYGPVREFEIEPGTQTCIYGHNESGKTAIVEVMTYVLFKRSSVHLRYPKPKGVHITVEDHKKHFTLPTKRQAPSLPSADIAPLLYVHASQSSIFADGTKDRFWDGLKAVLGGMEPGITYAKLDEKIFTVVGLQPKKEEWKQEKQQQVDGDRARKDALGDYIARVAGIEQAQVERRRLEQEQKKIETDSAAIEAWKKYTTYNGAARLYAAYRAVMTELQNYERYKPSYAARWQELEIMIRTHAKDKTKLQSVEQEVIDLERKRMDLQRKQDFIDAWDISPDQGASRPPVKPIATFLPMAATAVIALLFALSFFTPIPTLIAAIALALSLGISVLTLFRRRSIHRDTARHARILSKAEEIFPGVATFADLMAKIEQTRDDIIRVTTLISEKRDLKQHFANAETVSDIDTEIADLRAKTGLAELADLKQKLEKQRTLDIRRNELYGKICGMLGEKNDTMWERILDRMKVPAPDTEPDMTREQQLQKARAAVEKRIYDLDKQVSIFMEIQKTTYRIDDPGTAFTEYDRLVKKLQEYELEKKAALTARQVFAEMSAEQDDYLHDVISGDHGLAAYFKIITGRYDTVLIRDKDFVVRDTGGTEYPIDSLSSGTRDQLLLCFRLAALSKAYPDGSFLILDDAFIFADWPRRTKMMDLIEAFAQRGNQILYFTSDDHTRDLFQEHGTPVVSLH